MERLLLVLSLLALALSAYLFLELSNAKAELAQLREEMAALEGVAGSLELKGDVVGPVDNTQIAEGAVGSGEIADGSISAVDVDSAEIQLRVKEACPQGSFVWKINEDGTVVCSSPTSPNFTTPAIAQVLAAGGDAEGHALANLSSLESQKVVAGEVEVDSLAASLLNASRVCIGHNCTTAFPKLKLVNKSVSVCDGNADIGYYELCFLTSVYKPHYLNDTVEFRCSFGYLRRKGWILEAENACCSATCFNITLSYE